MESTVRVKKMKTIQVMGHETYSKKKVQSLVLRPLLRSLGHRDRMEPETTRQIESQQTVTFFEFIFSLIHPVYGCVWYYLRLRLKP